MRVTVWTLTIDGDYSVSTTVHGTEGEAFAELRKHADDDFPGGTNGALCDYLSEAQGLVFYGPEPATITVPDAALLRLRDAVVTMECPNLTRDFNLSATCDALHDVLVLIDEELAQ